MTAPLLSAYSFNFFDEANMVIADITVETPTALGDDHAQRVAICHLKKMPAVASKWNGKGAFLVRRCSAAAFRRKQKDAISDTLRDWHKTKPTGNGNRGPVTYVPSKF